MSFSYKTIVDACKHRNCFLLTTEDEFDKLEGPMSKRPITIQLECNHNAEIRYNSFRRKLTNVCKKCCDKLLIEKNKNLLYNIKESEVFQTFREFLENDFEVKKTNEGCKADMIVRPINSEEDIWLPVQLKSSHSVGHQYNFGHTNKYDRMIIFCICTSDNKIWCFNGSLLLKVSNLTIGLTRSKYDDYEIEFIDLVRKTKEAFNSEEFDKDTECNLKIPVSVRQQTEHSNRLLRENIFNGDYILEYPDIDGSQWDCKINSKKIQDKCLYEYSKVKDYFVISSILNFKKGDIDYYWFNLKDTSLFYVIPDKLMNACEDGKIKTFLCLCPYPRESMGKYDIYIDLNKKCLFDYENFDKVKFSQVFQS